MNVLAQDTEKTILQYIGSWCLKICIFLGTIYLLHQIFLYVKDTFTTPKKTNIIQLHKKQYNEIENIIKQQQSSTEETILSGEQKEYLAKSLLNLLSETS